MFFGHNASVLVLVPPDGADIFEAAYFSMPGDLPECIIAMAFCGGGKTSRLPPIGSPTTVTSQDISTARARAYHWALENHRSTSSFLGMTF